MMTIVFGMNSMFAVRQFLPEVLEMVSRRGLRPVVIAPRSAGILEGLPPGCSATDLRFIPLKREISPLSDLRSLWRIWSLLLSIRPAITNMSTPKMALLGGLAAWLAGVPRRIYTLRGLRYETARSWKRLLLIQCERVACACAHQVICVSRSVKEAAVRDRICPAHKAALLGERVSEGITLARRGSIERNSPSDLRREIGIPDHARVIGFVGRLTRDKGIEELVACFRALLDEDPHVHLLLLGDFEPGDPVDRDTVAYIRSHTHVHWMGYVTEPRPYYEVMDVFVFPTRREGLGRVLLEAAAAGKPVVSTRTTGVIDVVQEDLTGLLVRPGDIAALIRATATLLGDSGLAARMGRNARALIREHFDNTIYLERLGNMMESLAHGPPAVGRRIGSPTRVGPRQE